MILMYSKSSILLQLHFLWSLNSNLQINRLWVAYRLPICQLLFKRKDMNNHTLYKDQICPRVKVLIHFIFHHYLQSKKLSAKETYGDLWHNISNWLFKIYFKFHPSCYGDLWHNITLLLFPHLYCIYVHIYMNVTGIYLKQGVGRGLVPSFEIGPMRCLLEYLRE